MINICGIEFKTKLALEKYVIAIMGRYPEMGVLRGADHDFMYEILRRHPSKSIGDGTVQICVQWLSSGFKRFVIRLKDGSINDFSWRKSLSPDDHAQKIHKVCRVLIQDQIQAYRNKAFATDIALKCPISGEMVTRDECDIDHEAPLTFNVLVANWLESIHTEIEAIELRSSGKYADPTRFTDEFFEESWRQYHRINARLRVVSRPAHRSLPRKNSDGSKQCV